MVDLCFAVHVRRSCIYGARCCFVHETTYDPAAVYFTCTWNSRRRVKNARRLFGLPPLSRPLLIVLKKTVRSHSGYCSDPDDLTSLSFFRTIRALKTTWESDAGFAARFEDDDQGGHCCCCGGGTSEEVVSVQYDVLPNKLLAVPLPMDLLRIVKSYVA